MNLKFWTTTETYAWHDYRKYLPLINEQTKPYIIAGTLVAATALTLLALRYLRKPVAQKPNICFESTLNIAGLALEAPSKKAPPPNVAFTFCIDTSSSMQGEREAQVKKGISDLLDDAHRRAANGANFEIGMIGFNDRARIISAPKKITEIAEIKKELEAYTSYSSTEILIGLNNAAEQLDAMHRVNKAAMPVLVLLTDGENNVSVDRLAPIQQKLASINARLYAIGIGKDHRKQTLQTIAPDRYIDTTNGRETILSAISKIYNETISQYSDIRLSTNLKAGTWSVNRTPSVSRNGRSACDLGFLAEGKKMEHYIAIHGEKLDANLPLSSVKFELSYRDPRGIQGQTTLHWKPNTTINSALCKRAHQFI